MARRKKIGWGCECSVYYHSPRVVLKVYGSRGERDDAFERQKKACRVGIAPPTRGKKNYGRRFGYLSCAANMEGGPDGYVLAEEHLVLRRKMRSLGFRSLDLHEDNIGRYKNKPVVIDFGNESTT